MAKHPYHDFDYQVGDHVYEIAPAGPFPSAREWNRTGVVTARDGPHISILWKGDSIPLYAHLADAREVMSPVGGTDAELQHQLRDQSKIRQDQG